MTALDDLLTDAGRRHVEGEKLVREVVEREGAEAVVSAVTRLVETRAPKHGEAILFLMEGEGLPDLAAAIEANEELPRVLEAMLSSPNVRDRRLPLWVLGRLPVRDRFDVLERAAAPLLAAKELVTLSELLVHVALPDIIDRLVESEDWLLRWSLLPWTNHDCNSPIAGDVRRRLAFDDHPLVAAEAHQHLMILEEWETAHANAPGFAFGLLSNHGPATSFSEVAAKFVESWPPEKTTYELEELRAFASGSVRDDS